jgi:hypothetical protein
MLTIDISDMGGIGLQQLFILLFLFIAYNFQRKMNSTPVSQVPSTNWHGLLYALYGALVLITVSTAPHLSSIGLSLMLSLVSSIVSSSSPDTT